MASGSTEKSKADFFGATLEWLLDGHIAKKSYIFFCHPAALWSNSIHPAALNPVDPELKIFGENRNDFFGMVEDGQTHFVHLLASMSKIAGVSFQQKFSMVLDEIFGAIYTLVSTRSLFRKRFRDLIDFLRAILKNCSAF